MEQIAIGRIRTSFGVKGFLKVLSFSGQAEHFLDLRGIVLKNKGKEKIFTVESARSSGSSILLKLKGIDSPEEGKSYAGWEIWVPREFAAPLEPGEYYLNDLNGCEIVNSGKVLGRVVGVGETSINDLLEVKTESGVYIIPFKEEFIGDVDLESRKIELKTVWLLQ